MSCSSDEGKNVYSKIIEPIEQSIKETEQKLKHHHNEKFTFYNFCYLLIFYFVSGQKSCNQFIDALKKNQFPSELNLKPVPYSTFKDGFERFSPELFKNLFVKLLSVIAIASIPELNSLGQLYLVDGSLLPTLSNMSWAKYKTGANAIKIHLCFNLNKMIPGNFIVGTGKSCERKALLKMLKSGITYIADRGYSSFNIFNKIIENDAFFIFRARNNIIIKKVVENLKIEISDSISKLFRNVTDQIIMYKNDPFKNKIRLVCFEIGEEIYYIVTNRFDLTTEQIIILYAYRWQIELFFRYMKRTINGLHLIINNKNGVTIQFYVIMIASLLMLNFKQDCINKKNDLEKDSSMSRKFEDKTSNISNRIGNVKRAPELLKKLGQNYKKYWKIGILWLNTMRTNLHKVFDSRAIFLLGGG